MPKVLDSTFSKIIMCSDAVARSAAKSEGLKRYLSSKPCTAGHVGERWVRNYACVACGVDRYTQWRKAFPERMYASKKKWEANNREKHMGSRHDWYNRNKDRENQKRRNDYAANPEKILVEVYKWKSENIEKARQSVTNWRKHNRDKVIENISKRRARKYNSEGSHTEQEIKLLFAKQKGKCANCFNLLPLNFHRDHIIPLILGGSNWIQNIQLLCPPCNLKKHAKDPVRFAQEQGRLL